ncbi:MAG: ABC transporter ATP-binding protein [Deltaproteobacteria bacterium]|nr:ABC transporter ATP-binding protein [Deltaproteobacteria bacterium]
MTPRLERAESRNVSKIYGRHRALHKVSLTLVAGRVTALLGPNGSGKTTLLSLFSTLSRPSSGTMHFGELPPEKSKLARGAIGLLSHASLSYGELSAKENVAFFGRLAGIRDPYDAARRLLVEFGLEDAMDRPARTFSRGMLQRLGLARALVSNPSLVLLDEPFTGLDRASAARVVEKVAELRDAGAIVLLVSHDLGITAELADDAAILVRGKLAHRHEGRLGPDAFRALYTDAVEAKKEAAA